MIVRLQSGINRESVLPALAILILAAASCVRVWTISGTMWDDNAWLMSAYATHDLQGFLNTGFFEMRRVPLGIVLYPLFWLYKNTNLYYVVWHSLNMVTQIGAPLILYATCLRLFGNQRLLAFLIAATLAVISLDQTLPYASAVNYRIGLLLGIISFYFTVRSLQSARPWISLVVSLITAFAGYTVFIEAVMMLEPGRFAVIMYLLHRQTGMKGMTLTKTALLRWLPFIAACVPFAIYKLVYKPFGFYGGIYRPNLLFWLNWQENINLAAFLLLFQWVIFLGYLSKVSAWSVTLGIVCVAVLIPLLRLLISRSTRMTKIRVGRMKSPRPDDPRQMARHALYIGLILMVPSFLLFQFVGRPVTWGIYSSHGTIGQFGYAIVLGALLFWLLQKVANKGELQIIMYCSGIAVFFAAGIFFNNLNLDLYRTSHRQQNEFWKAFVQRFPNLPTQATFLFDIKNDSLYHPQYYYDHEFPLNLLYMENRKPEEFRRYRVCTSYELYRLIGTKASRLKDAHMARRTLWGVDQFEPAGFIAVYYDQSGLLVNKEIIQRFPGTPYRELLDKPFPELPHGYRRYPLRHEALKQN